MKLLFQGGWRDGRNSDDERSVVEGYCLALARYLVASRHQIILTSSNRPYDALIAQEVETLAREAGRNVKDILIFMLSERYTEIPSIGKVMKFERHGHWFEERTYLIQQSDVVMAVGGGTGTLDCVQKAFLAKKPVFIASAIPSPALEAWKKRPVDYYYIHNGDADFVNDLNVTSEEFFREAFRIIDSLEGVKYSRKVFIIHGRDLHARDCLAAILRKLQFEPIILQREASHSLTVIEKLERDAMNAGFAFVMYTPDDMGHLQGEPERFRARQNVVFEHGLLVGHLGRERTCALVTGDIEVPSDLLGIIFQRFSNLEEESINVARTLKQAGYSVNPEALM